MKKIPSTTQSGRSKATLIIALALFACVLFTTSVWLLKNDQVQLMGELVYRVDTQKKVVALTFDDGPTAGRTQAVLKVLSDENVPATFYLNGNMLEKNRVEAQLLINSGHEIGNHSFSHSKMVFMSYNAVASEIEKTASIIKNLGYSGSLDFRPPYGKSLFMLPLYLRNNNITTITWDVAPEWFDGEDTPEVVYQRTMDQVQPGSIVLLHVMYGDGSTLTALPKIIHSLKRQGYRFKTVTELRELSQNVQRSRSLTE